MTAIPWLVSCTVGYRLDIGWISRRVKQVACDDITRTTSVNWKFNRKDNILCNIKPHISSQFIPCKVVTSVLKKISVQICTFDFLFLFPYFSNRLGWHFWHCLCAKTLRLQQTSIGKCFWSSCLKFMISFCLSPVSEYGKAKWHGCWCWLKSWH